MDPGPGDEGAVVEAVAQLGERAEAARQARVDDLDRDSHRQDGVGDFLARIRLARTRREVVAKLERKLALELGGNEIGDAQLDSLAANVVHPGLQQRRADRDLHPERLALGRGHGGDLPAADGAELARSHRPCNRYASARSRGTRSSGQDSMARASRLAAASAVLAASNVLSFMADCRP